MPYLVVCPKCSAKLKSGVPVAAGRSLNCPQCKVQFTLDKPAAEIEGTGPTPIAPAKPVAAAPPAKPAPRPQAEESAPRRGRAAPQEEIPSAEIVDAADFDSTSKPKSRRRQDDDDDRPAPRRKREEPDDEDRPRSRRSRDDDEDDRPTPRRKRDEAEDDDRLRAKRRARDDDDDRQAPARGPSDDFAFDDAPKVRNRRDDDDEDERPKARKSRIADDDDFEDDEQSRPRSRKGKKSNKKVLLIALIGGGAAFMFLLCAGLVLIFDPFGLNLFGSSSSEMLAWAPADSQAIIFMDVEGMEKVDSLKGNFKGELSDSTKLGLKQNEVSAVLGAGRTAGGGDPDVTVVKLRDKADQKRFIDASGGKEATANGKKYYKTNGGGGLYFASDKMLVVTKTDAIMTGLLQKDSSKVVISDDLQAAAKRGDGLFWMAASGQTAEKADMIGMISGLGNFMGGFGPGGPAPKTPSKCKSTLMTMKASGNQGTSRMESTYDSPDTAKRIADDLKKAMDLAKSKSTDFTSFDVSTSGSTVTLTITGPIKQGKGFIPGLPGGGF